MSFSVIIPYIKGEENRRNGLVEMLKRIRSQTFRDFELILCEATQDGTSDYLPFSFDQRFLLRFEGRFNKSWVINYAVRNAKHNKILVLDADTLFESDYFQKVWDYYDKYKNNFFVAYTVVHFLVGRDEPTPRSLKSSYIKAAAHAFFFDRDFFWSVGGMNEKYFGYGAEDQDLWFRVAHREGILIDMPYEIQHAYHHWHPKDSAFPLNERRVPLLEETQHDVEGEIQKLLKIKDQLGREKPYGT